MLERFGFLKTTAIGGLIFLLPLIVIGALLGQVIQIVLTVATVLGEWLPIDTPTEWALVVALALAVVVALCFLAGLAARRSFARRFSQLIEKNLLLFFPRYAIVREQMTGNFCGEIAPTRLKPVLVEFDDAQRIAFEVDRTDDGPVAVYLPGAPDPWSGEINYVASARVAPLDLEFSQALATFEQLGRNSAHILAAATAPTSSSLGESEAAKPLPESQE